MSKIKKDYIIKEKIGTGTHGDVYKSVKKDRPYEKYAIKVISIEGLSEKEIESIQTEVLILQSLSSSYITKYYESFIDTNHNNNDTNEGKSLYIVMEYCENGDLDSFLQKFKKTKDIFFPEEKAWKVIVDISIGLYELHTKNILHRDLKTKNIFISSDFKFKIGDFGVAKVMSNINDDFAYTFIGTPYYLSPEICEGKAYNSKSDIWSLGCVFYEVLALRKPFEAKSQGVLMLQILKESYLSLSGEYSKALKGLVYSCLQKDLKKRPSIIEILSKEEVGKVLKKMNYGFEKYIDINTRINSRILKKNPRPKSGIVDFKNKKVNNFLNGKLVLPYKNLYLKNKENKQVKEGKEVKGNAKLILNQQGSKDGDDSKDYNQYVNHCIDTFEKKIYLKDKENLENDENNNTLIDLKDTNQIGKLCFYDLIPTNTRKIIDNPIENEEKPEENEGNQRNPIEIYINTHDFHDKTLENTIFEWKDISKIKLNTQSDEEDIEDQEEEVIVIDNKKSKKNLLELQERIEKILGKEGFLKVNSVICLFNKKNTNENKENNEKVLFFEEIYSKIERIIDDSLLNNEDNSKIKDVVLNLIMKYMYIV